MISSMRHMFKNTGQVYTISQKRLQFFTRLDTGTGLGIPVRAIRWLLQTGPPSSPLLGAPVQISQSHHTQHSLSAKML